jgi:sarcosine oxidase subunit alpha
MKRELKKRLTTTPTLHIDPERPLGLTYQGEKLSGVSGDTIATALYANGFRIFSRSIKYHRPRGLYSLNGESANCLMEVDGIPNVNTEYTLLREGMTIKPQNVKGTPEKDLMGFADYLDWAMPAGFYYRRFHRPYKLWPVFMKHIRKTAGIGKIDPEFQIKGRFEERYINTDVCVIGGGPAGLSAALAASQHGMRVVLLEARPWMGGCFDYRIASHLSNSPLFKRTRKLTRAVSKEPNIRVFPYTSMTGFYGNNIITAIQKRMDMEPFDERYIEIRTKAAVVATGCIERPLIFDNNDRPQIMQISCAHRLAHTYGILPGKEAVFSVEHDLGLEAAIDLDALGVNIICIADSRHDGQNPALVASLEKRGIPILRGWVASKAYGTKHIKRVRISTLEGMRHRHIECDLLVASAGLTPITGPLNLLGIKMAYDFHTGYYLPKDYPPGIFAAGRLLGFQNPEAIQVSGELAGLLSAETCGAGVAKHVKVARERLAELPGPLRGSKLVQAPVTVRRRFVDFDEDVTVKHIDQACHLGFDAVELNKRFTAAGTGPGQGGISGHNLPLVIAQYKALSPDKINPTTVRPPLHPTLLAAYAGKNHNIYKQTPVHKQLEQANGIFRRIGNWMRVRYLSNDFSSQKEIEAVRQKVGIIDVSTLGKFRIFGSDALKALERMYVGDMSNTAPGKLKYSAMCNEDGCLIDDGVIVKTGENDYYFTTSTGRADATIEWFRYHTRYDGWSFHMVNLTDAFGAINLAGPHARDVLEKITDADVSNQGFPFMGYREFKLINGVQVRALRVGFVGELSYELHIPASLTADVWDMLLEAGQDLGIAIFGLEAQNVLRMEKGHVIIGQESEIRTTLHDLGMGFLWARKKPVSGTIGAVALSQTEHQEGRLKLIGFQMDSGDRPPRDGSLIVDKKIHGHICTARYSETLKKPIGLAFLESQCAVIGNPISIFEDNCDGNLLKATVIPTPFYDPSGERMKC